MRGWREPGSGLEHASLSMGDLRGAAPVLARVHSECLTGDAFGSLRCDCGPQLKAALQAIAAQRRGVLVYLRQEGRGIGLVNKMRAYALQDYGADTVDANRLLGLPDDARDYGAARDILVTLGVRRVALLTNNPAKVRALRGLGIVVSERVPLVTGLNAHNRAYLDTKRRRFGHALDAVGPVEPTATEGELGP